MTIALEDYWVWDSWYAKDGALWHGYFLKAPKSIGDPELRHWNVSIGHAVSKDLINWEHKGTCFAPSTEDSWDDFTTWTGSVVKGDDNLWHLFYTGTSKSEDGTYQRIGHAVSSDLHNWKRVGDGLCLEMEGPNLKYYEHQLVPGFWHERAMRDPWVMKNPNGSGWLMYFTARAAGVEETNAAGAIGFATSNDLYAWELKPPVFSGGFGQLEVPQVFEVDGRWYCLFCTAGKHFSKEVVSGFDGKKLSGNHYLTADSPQGPWTIASGSFFDGAETCRRYASRIVKVENEMKLLGFMDNAVDGCFGGYVMNPVPVEVDADGLLQIGMETQ